MSVRDAPLLTYLVIDVSDPQKLADTVQSIARHVSSQFEVLIALPVDAAPVLSGLVRHLAASDRRIRAIRVERTEENALVRQARGRYITTIEAGRRAVPTTFDEIARALVETRSEAAFAAVAWIDGAGAPLYSGELTPTALSTSVDEHPSLATIRPRSVVIMSRSFADELARRGNHVPTASYARILAQASRIDVYSTPIVFAAADDRSRAPVSGPRLAGWHEDLHLLGDAHPGARRYLAQDILSSDLLAGDRGVVARVEDPSEIAWPLSRLLQECAEHCDSDFVASFPIIVRWELALLALARPDLVHYVRETSHRPLDEVDLGALSVASPESLTHALGLGSDSFAEAFHSRFIARHSAAPVAPPADRDAIGPEISVIVPTRNVEQYIDELLASLRRVQDIVLEVIIVDDGSTDATWERIQEHAAADPRVRTFRSSGSGGGSARNFGTSVARGEYLAFADGDDIVPRGAYATMLSAARETGAEIVSGDYLKLFLYDTWNARDEYGGAYRSTLVGANLLAHPQLATHRTCWNRLYSRSFWEKNGLSFPDVARANDIVPVLSALAAATSMVVIPDVTYVYRNRPGAGSMTSGVGSAAYTLSYLDQETTCARIIAAADGEYLSRVYWGMVLGADGSRAIRDYLRESLDLDPTSHDAVSHATAQLRAEIPQGLFVEQSPSTQAMWALAAAGRLDDASVAASDASSPTDWLIALEGLNAVSGVSDRVIAWLLMTEVILRLGELPSGAADVWAVRACALAVDLGEWDSLLQASGGDAFVGGVIDALRDGQEARASAALSTEHRPTVLDGTFGMKGLTLTWREDGVVRPTRQMLAVGRLGEREIRVPVGTISVDAAGTSSLRLRAQDFPSPGTWRLALDGSGLEWSHERDPQVPRPRWAALIGRLRRMTLIPASDHRVIVRVRMRILGRAVRAVTQRRAR